jgi:hypothetical protein
MRPDVWRLLLVSLSGLILANILKSSDWKSLACNIELFLDGNSRLVMKCFLEYSYRSLFQRKAVKLDFLSIMLIKNTYFKGVNATYMIITLSGQLFVTHDFS